MAIQTRKITATEFLELPVSSLPHELLDGEEIMSPAPTIEHQRVLFRLAQFLAGIVPNGEVFLSPLDLYLDEVNVVQPDIVWIATNSNCIPVEGKYFKGAPELVVEIFSPGTGRRDRKDKFRLYEKYGVREYWMVDPGEKLPEIWQLKDAQFVLVDVFGPDDKCQSPLLGEVDMKAIFPS
jgi:Uma2 family endonuclease